MQHVHPVGSREALRRMFDPRAASTARYQPGIADWIAVATGVLLILAPLLFGFTAAEPAKLACWIAGAAICASAGLLFMGWVRAGRVALLLTVVGAAIAPYALGLGYFDAPKLALWTAAIVALGCAMPSRRPSAD